MTPRGCFSPRSQLSRVGFLCIFLSVSESYKMSRGPRAACLGLARLCVDDALSTGAVMWHLSAQATERERFCRRACGSRKC